MADSQPPPSVSPEEADVIAASIRPAWETGIEALPDRHVSPIGPDGTVRIPSILDTDVIDEEDAPTKVAPAPPRAPGKHSSTRTPAAAAVTRQPSTPPPAVHSIDTRPAFSVQPSMAPPRITSPSSEDDWNDIPKPPRQGRAGVIVAVVGVLAILGGGGYLFLNANKPAPAESATQNAVVVPQAKSAVDLVPPPEPVATEAPKASAAPTTPSVASPQASSAPQARVVPNIPTPKPAPEPKTQAVAKGPSGGKSATTPASVFQPPKPKSGGAIVRDNPFQ